MTRVVRSKRAILALMAGLALFAFACSDSNSPTSLATQPEPLLVPASANSVADAREDVFVQAFWATALGEPELIVRGDRQWIRVLVACRHSPEGPDTRAVFNFHGRHMTDGANLWTGAEFYAKVKEDGFDGRDMAPAYRVVKCKMPDHK